MLQLAKLVPLFQSASRRSVLACLSGCQQLPALHLVCHTTNTASDRHKSPPGRKPYGESEGHSSPPPLLLRCTIFCKRTGVCLMEKIWNWPLQASPHDMTKMIQTFHQISGQLGCKTKGTWLPTTSTSILYSWLLNANALFLHRGQSSHLSGKAGPRISSVCWTTSSAGTFLLSAESVTQGFIFLIALVRIAIERRWSSQTADFKFANNRWLSFLCSDWNYVNLHL